MLFCTLQRFPECILPTNHNIINICSFLSLVLEPATFLYDVF